MSAENAVPKALGDRFTSRHSDSERVDFTPCCFVEFRGEIRHGDKCQACGEIMLWCRGCGAGEGHEYTTCDGCGKEICPDCSADIDDPDCPADFCEDCCG